MPEAFADVKQYPKEVWHLLYEDENGAVIGLDGVQLLDPVPAKRLAPLRALLGSGDLYLVYQCAVVLTAWGDPAGLVKIEEFTDTRIDQRIEIAPHRIYDYDTVYDELAEAVGLFALSSADCRTDRMRVLRKILALYGPCFFESKLKDVLLEGDMPELLPDVQAAVARALALDRVYLASQLLPPLARWQGEAVRPLLAQFTSIPHNSQWPDMTANVAEALHLIPAAQPSVESFIAYVARYSPSFPDRVEGASDQEIARLEELSGHTLPDTYRQFLRRMGRNTAGIRFGDCHIHLRAVAAYYEAMRVNPRLTLPAGCLLIGAAGASTGELCLNLNTGSGNAGDDPRVVEVVGDNVFEFYASSLLPLLYQAAFHDCRLTSSPFQDYISSYEAVGRQDCRPEARRMAEKLGFVDQWFSETVHFNGERGDAGLYFSQPEGRGLTLRVAAETLTEAQEIGEQFVRAFGVTPFTFR